MLGPSFGTDYYNTYPGDCPLSGRGPNPPRAAARAAADEPRKKNCSTYEETMIGVAKYAQAEGIPYQYWLADSWWYYKGKGGGVTEWTAMPYVFPHGLEYLQQQTGWLVQGHNRYWSADNVYAKQNNGSYDFLVNGSYALPVDPLV